MPAASKGSEQGLIKISSLRCDRKHLLTKPVAATQMFAPLSDRGPRDALDSSKGFVLRYHERRAYGRD